MIRDFVKGPYKLATRFTLYRVIGLVFCVAATLACVLGYGAMGLGAASRLLHEQRVWNEGGPDLPAEFRGEVTTRQFVLKSYNLEVRYETPDGLAHTRELTFDTLFGGIDDDGSSTVRVSKTNPEDFAFDKAVKASGSRWASVAFFVVVGIGLLGGCFGFLTRAVVRQYLRVRRAISSGVPMLCRLDSREPVLNQGRPTGAEIFRFRVPAGDHGPERQVSYQCRTKGNGALLLANDSLVLAIVPPSAPADAVVVLQDFYPLALSEEQKAAALSALQGAAATAQSA